MPEERLLIFNPKIIYHVPSKSIRATPWIALEVARRCKNNDSTCPDTTSDYKRISHVNRHLLYCILLFKKGNLIDIMNLNK
jgi:hypothetical protein